MSQLLRPGRAVGAVLAVVLAAGLSSTAERTWVEARSPHFTVYSDAGAKDARRVAWQFEQIRGAFQKIWPRARLESSRPMLILAARDEDTLKTLVPVFWQKKGGARPAGVFFHGHDKHCIALRGDAQGMGEENPYHVLYHEDAHLLPSRNFTRLPLWRDERLAEFYGATVVRDDAIVQGKPIPMHILLLRDVKHLTIETLLKVDQSSPEFNEDTRATIFYAQSWALVHYFLLGSRDLSQAKKLV